jgi:hypothetical protein
MIFIIIAEVLYVVFHVFSNQKPIPELDEGKIYRETRDLMVETRFACRFSFKPVQRP